MTTNIYDHEDYLLGKRDILLSTLNLEIVIL